MNKWQKTLIAKPKIGSLVFVKTRREGCACSGYDDREVYYDGEFQGIKNQGWVDKWRYSPNNDILSQLEKELIKPSPCNNCVV